MSILFIRGINDKNTVSLSPGPGGSTRYAYDGCCGVYWFMNFDSQEAEAITLFGGSYPQQQVHMKLQPSLVFNEISDPDSHRGALQCCEQLCRQLQLPVLNHPTRILQTTREHIPTLLQDIDGLEVPLTIRITPRSPAEIFSAIEASALDYPVIVRLAGSHGGVSSILINSRDDLDKLHVYPYDGSDFYLTRFVDYVSDDGYYRKYRIVVIDGVPLCRHHLIDRQWMIHASSREFMQQHPGLDTESSTRLETFDEQLAPVIRPVIDKITQRLQLHYYGIDCNIDNQGKILIFEVNANMNVLSNQIDSLQSQMDRIRKSISTMLDKYAAGNGQPAPVRKA